MAIKRQTNLRDFQQTGRIRINWQEIVREIFRFEEIKSGALNQVNGHIFCKSFVLCE